MLKMITVVVAMVVGISAGAVHAADAVSLPKGYEKWEKSKRKIVEDKKSLFYGIHYIYADKKAIQGYKAGGKNFPEGSRFVITFFSIKDEGGKPAEGKKNMVVYMKKDKKYSQTGGWLFAGYNPDGKPSGIDPVKNCFECHVKEAKDRDFVISRYEEFK